MNQASQVIHQWAENAVRSSMHAYFRFAQQKDFSMTQLNSLFLLRSREHITVNELARQCEISTSAASQIAERLVSQGLVEREEDPRDRRIRLLSLTPAGFSLIEEAQRKRHAWIDELVQKLSDSEKEQAVSIFTVLNAHLTNFIDIEKKELK